VGPNVYSSSPAIVCTTLATPFELNCGDYEFKSASVGHGRGGAVFRCTLSPVTDETLKGLTDAIRSNQVIRFAFPKHPLILEGIEVERVAPGSIRIAGRVLDD
jgi:hypothetical protein